MKTSFAEILAFVLYMIAVLGVGIVLSEAEEDAFMKRFKGTAFFFVDKRGPECFILNLF